MVPTYRAKFLVRRRSRLFVARRGVLSDLAWCVFKNAPVRSQKPNMYGHVWIENWNIRSSPHAPSAFWWPAERVDVRFLIEPPALFPPEPGNQGLIRLGRNRGADGGAPLLRPNYRRSRARGGTDQKQPRASLTPRLRSSLALDPPSSRRIAEEPSNPRFSRAAVHRGLSRPPTLLKVVSPLSISRSRIKASR